MRAPKFGLFAFFVCSLFSLAAHASRVEPTRLIYKLSSQTTWVVEIQESIDPESKSVSQTVSFILDDRRYSDEPVTINSQEVFLESLTLPSPDVISGPNLAMLGFDNLKTHHDNLVHDGYFMASFVYATFPEAYRNYAPETRVFSILQIISKQWPFFYFTLPELQRSSSYPLRYLNIVPVFNDTQNYLVSITDSKPNGQFIRTIFKTRGQGQPPEKIESITGEKFVKNKTPASLQPNNLVEGLDNLAMAPAILKIANTDGTISQVATKDLDVKKISAPQTKLALRPTINREIIKSPTGKFDVRVHQFTGDIEIFKATTGEKISVLRSVHGIANVYFKNENLLILNYPNTNFIVAARIGENNVVAIDSESDNLNPNLCAEVLTRKKVPGTF